MKQRILANWTVVRFIRLIIGAGAASQGIFLRDDLITIAGIFVFVTALLNYGCCGSSGCPVTYSKKNMNNPAKYEEVGDPK